LEDRRSSKDLLLLATTGRVSSHNLLIELEHASGADLLDQMRPVFAPEEFALFKRRRELQRQFDTLSE
jgi:hypothetical protein